MSHTADQTLALEPLGVPFRRFFGVLRRRKAAVLLAVAVGVSAGAAFVSSMTPRYTAEAQILIEPRRTQVSDLQAISSDPDNSQNLMRTQIDILRSPALLNKVVDALQLQDVEEFSPRGGLVEAARDWLRSAGLDTSTALEPSKISRREIAARILVGKVAFANEARSNVLRVTVETEDPDLSARVANELAGQFLEFKRNQKFAATRRAYDWFQERLNELSGKLRASETEVAAYRQQLGLLEVPVGRHGGQRGPTVNAQQLNEISRQLAVAMAERLRKEAQFAQMQAALRGQGGAESVPEVLDSHLIQRLREQEALTAAREAELTVTGLERSPDLMAARAQRRGLQSRIQAEMKNITEGLANEVAAARAQEGNLRRAMVDLRTAVGAENTAEIRLQNLTAEAEANRVLYEGYLNRATQLANVSGIQEPDAEMVSPATPPPAPSAPRRGRLLAVVLLFSTAFGVLVAFLLERMRTGIRSPEELESTLGLAPLGVVPRTSIRSGQVRAVGRTSSDFAAAVSRVRGGLQVLEREKRPKVVMVTSALPREGKSVFAMSFAQSAARAGWRVLLVDCDMRKPAVASAAGLSTGTGPQEVLGLNNVLAGGLYRNIGPVVQKLPSGLHVLPTGASGGNAQDLLASQRMENLLQNAREEYDLVVLDTPPVLAVADALVLSRMADAAVLVVQWEKTSRALAGNALKLLRGSGAQVLGGVLTQVSLGKYVTSGAGDAAVAYRKLRRYYISGR